MCSTQTPGTTNRSFVVHHLLVEQVAGAGPGPSDIPGPSHAQQSQPPETFTGLMALSRLGKAWKLTSLPDIRYMMKCNVVAQVKAFFDGLSKPQANQADDDTNDSQAWPTVLSTFQSLCGIRWHKHVQCPGPL